MNPLSSPRSSFQPRRRGWPLGFSLAALGVTAALVGASPAQDRAKAPTFDGTALAGSMEQRSNGNPICGLGKEFHAGRRAALRAKLDPGVVVLRGLPSPRQNLRFHQDKNFWYLTGVESPSVAFVMDVESGKEILFVNRPSSWREQWEGEIWDTDDQWIKDLTGIQDLRSKRKLEDVIEELLDEGESLYTFGSSHIGLSGSYDTAGKFDKAQKADKWDGRITREKAFMQRLEERFGREVKDITGPLRELRLVKEPEELAAIRRASRAGGLAIMEGIRSTRPGLGEWDLGALMSWVQQRHGAIGPAYSAIVGSGHNSLVLHYNASVRRMEDGEVVLVDFGPEVDKYVTDITRTWPVNGKFTERQAELYDAVLDAQAAGIAASKPGSTLREVNQACSDVLTERGFQEFMAHGAVHWVGMEVHDPPPPGKVTLAPGMVFTIEPGLYEQATGIGIRIEDVVVITEDGCEILTPECPKSRSEIEALVAEEGVLDWMDRR